MAPIDDPVNEYISLLEKEIAAYNRFRDLLIEEQNILVSGKNQNLQPNIREQTVLMRDFRRMEERRLDKTKDIAERLMISDDSITLGVIADAIVDERKEQFLNLKEEFCFIVQDVIKINRNNNHLIEHGITFIQQRVEAIYEAIEKEFFYNPKKSDSKKSLKPFRLVDRKV